MKKKIVINVGAFLVVLLVLFLLQRLLMPKYVSEIREGSLIEEYYDDVKDHDVVFIGDCEVYENFSPITLWEKYGITSYIRGSAQQLMWQSYYLLEETLKYEKPKAVVFNVLAMKYNEPQKEAYNRLTLDHMKLSMSKIKDIKASMMDDESFISYIFPILRYHSRWNELTGDDFKYMFNKPQISHNGFLMRVDVKPATVIPEGKKLADYQFGENSYKYLDMMTKLCKDNGIELILIKAPSTYPYWYDEWDAQMVKYAQDNNLTYINFLDLTDDIGLDYNTDTYDGGLHLNLSGAEKLSVYFGRTLSGDFKIPDRRNEEETKKLWDKKVACYDAMKDDQERELAQYGYLKSYGAIVKNTEEQE